MSGGGYARTLARPGALRLMVTSVIGRLPLGMSLALLLLVRDTAGSFGDAGAVVGAFGIAAAVGQPPLGRLVDRFGQTRVLVPAAVAHSALLVAIVLAAHGRAATPALMALAAAAGACLPPISACLRALLPELAPDPAAREAAFALDATVQEVIWTSGPLLVGGLVAVASPSAAVLAMAAVTLGGTAAFATSSLSRAWRSRASRHGGVLRSPGMLVIIVSAVGAGMSMGAGEVGFPALADELGAPGATGPLLGLASLGSLGGGLIYGARTWATPLARRLALLIGLAAVLVAPLLTTPPLAIALVAAFVSGMAWAPALSCMYALVGNLAPAGTVTEAFTWSGAALGGGIAGGVAVGGLVVDTGGAEAAFWLGLATAAGAALVAAAGRRRLVDDGTPAAAVPVDAVAANR